MRDFFKRLISVLLVMCMILPANGAWADEENEEIDFSEMYAEDRHGKTLSDFHSDKKGNMSYTRQHTKATTGVQYMTRSLIMSKAPLSVATTDITREKYARSATADDEYVMVPLRSINNDTDGDQVISTYYFTNDELETAAKALGITDDDHDGFIDIYITHVFEIAPANKESWESLKNRIGKINNSANDKAGNGGAHYLTANNYDTSGLGSLAWYRTMDEFVNPGGISTFWSNGEANTFMYDCMNMKITVRVNPEVYAPKLSM